MATPVTDILSVMREGRKQRDENKDSKVDAILALTKLDNEERIRVLSTNIGIMEDERKTVSENIRTQRATLDEVNSEIEYMLGETDKISVKEFSTSAKNVIGDDIGKVVENMKLRNDNLYKTEEALSKGVFEARSKHSNLVELQSYFNEGIGVTDVTGDNEINADDVSLKNYITNKKFDTKDDAETIEYLTRFAKDLTPNEQNLLKLNQEFLANKVSIKESKDVFQEDVKEFYDTAIQSGNITYWKDLENATLDLQIAEGNFETSADVEGMRAARLEIDRVKLDIFSDIMYPGGLGTDGELVLDKIKKDMETEDMSSVLEQYRYIIKNAKDYTDVEVKAARLQEGVLDKLIETGSKQVEMREKVKIGIYDEFNINILELEDEYIQALNDGNEDGAEAIRERTSTMWGVDLNQKNVMDQIRASASALEAGKIDRVLSGLTEESTDIEETDDEKFMKASVSDLESSSIVNISDTGPEGHPFYGLTDERHKIVDYKESLVNAYTGTDIGQPQSDVDFEINPTLTTSTVDTGRPGGGTNVSDFIKTDIGRYDVDLDRDEQEELDKKKKDDVLEHNLQEIERQNALYDEMDERTQSINITGQDTQQTIFKSLDLFDSPGDTTSNWLEEGVSDESDPASHIRQTFIDMDDETKEAILDSNFTVGGNTDNNDLLKYMIQNNTVFKEAFTAYMADRRNPENTRDDPYSEFELLKQQLIRVYTEYSNQQG